MSLIHSSEVYTYNHLDAHNAKKGSGEEKKKEQCLYVLKSLDIYHRISACHHISSHERHGPLAGSTISDYVVSIHCWVQMACISLYWPSLLSPVQAQGQTARERDFLVILPQIRLVYNSWPPPCDQMSHGYRVWGFAEESSGGRAGHLVRSVELAHKSTRHVQAVRTDATPM